MCRIVVVGGGGHAKVLISILRKLKTFDVLGYTDIKDNGPILGVPFLGADSVLEDLKKQHASLSGVIGLGAVMVSDKREQLRNMLIQEGFDLPAIVSPDAIVNEDVVIGKGTVVFDGAVINSGTKIGECSIINTNSTVEHDCEIGNYVHIAPGATLSGGVKVGNNTIVGIGVNIIQNIRIAENCYIGAGATVSDDCPEPGLYLGTPARKAK